MAFKMQLAVPQEGMRFIWNISRHVGVLAESANAPEDVELVQRLIIERFKVSPSKVPRAPTIGSLRNATGIVDTITAFEIYFAGDGGKPLKDAERISPAKFGSINYGNGFWTIGFLNFKLFKVAPQVWENLPSICSPQLRTALLTKTAP